MTRRLLVSIVILAVAAAAAAVAVWAAWSSRDASPAAVPASVANVPPETSEPNPIQPAPQNEPPMDTAALSLKQTAMAFAEGYGSYSTDAPYENMKALDRFFTNSYRQAVQAMMSDGASGAAAFYSSNSRALILDVIRQDAASAEVMVQVQREERFGRDSEPRLSYQKLGLAMVLSNGRWLVDSAEWEQ